MTPNRAFIVTNRRVLFDAAYAIAQTLIGEQDGGVSSLYEHSRWAYMDTFANEGGAEPINAILRYVNGIDAVRRIEAAEVRQVEEFQDVRDETIPEIAKLATSAWIDYLVSQFPEVPADEVRHAASGAEKAFNHYLRFEQAYTNAYPRTNEVAQSATGPSF